MNPQPPLTARPSSAVTTQSVRRLARPAAQRDFGATVYLDGRNVTQQYESNTSLSSTSGGGAATAREGKSKSAWGRVRTITVGELDSIAAALLDPKNAREFTHISELLQEQKFARKGGATPQSGQRIRRRSKDDLSRAIVQNRELHKVDAVQTIQRVRQNKEYVDLFTRAYFVAQGVTTHTQLTLGRFKEFARDAELLHIGLTTASLEIMFQNLSKPHATMSFEAFVLATQYIADVWYPTEPNNVQRLEAIVDNKLRPYVKRSMQAIEDPLAWYTDPNRSIDVDRVLYTYHNALSRVFTHFAEKIPNRIALSEPNYYELGGPFNSAISLTKLIELLMITSLYPKTLPGPTVTRVAKASACLHVGHYSKRHGSEEIMLLEPEFVEFTVRIADWVMRGHGETTSIRVTKFLDDILFKLYKALFDVPVQRDLDFGALPLPTLSQIVPPRISAEQGQEVWIYGSGFSKKKGLYVRIHGLPHVSVRCPRIEPSEAMFYLPNVFSPNTAVEDQDMFFNQFDITCSTDFAGDTYIKVTKFRLCNVQVSNNQRDWVSSAVPLVFERRMQPFILFGEVKAKATKAFAYFANKAVGAFMAKFMTEALWLSFCETFEITERSGSVLSETDLVRIFNSHATAHLKKTEKKIEELCLDFDEFISATVHLNLMSSAVVHPSASLDDLLGSKELNPERKHNRDIEQQRRAVCTVLQDILRTSTRPVRVFDVFWGPLLIGTVQEAPRNGKVTLLKEKASSTHSCLSFVECNSMMRAAISRHLTLTSSFDEFLRRLRASNLDLAPAAERAKRQPIKRAWKIMRGSIMLATLWHYPGNIATMDWVPVEEEASNKAFTMMVYGAELHSQDFLHLYTLFMRFDDISKLRDAFEMLGYELVITVPTTK